jgi:hypothetical protein
VVKYNLANDSETISKQTYEVSAITSKSKHGSVCEYAQLEINTKYNML